MRSLASFKARDLTIFLAWSAAKKRAPSGKSLTTLAFVQPSTDMATGLPHQRLQLKFLM